MTEISIVSVFHNRAPFVAASLASLLTQTHDDYEVIVVDDGSTNGTWAEIERFDHPRLTKLRQRNRGFTPTINAAVCQSRGKLVAIHGAGDISLPRRLECQAQAFDHPEVVVATCGMKVGDRIHHPRGWGRPAPLDLGHAMLTGNVFSHGEVMFKRACFDAVGGYREFFTFSQDLDLWSRLATIGGYAVVPEVLYERVEGARGISRSIPLQLQQQRFSAYARYCARVRARHSIDPVDLGLGDTGSRRELDRIYLMQLTRIATRAIRRRNLLDLGRITIEFGRELTRALQKSHQALVAGSGMEATK